MRTKALKITKVFHLIILSICSLFFILSGCTTTTAPRSITSTKPLPDTPGLYYKVEKKDTLWKIAQKYNVELDELIKINHISDITNIEVGQLIYIPNIKKKQPIITKYTNEDFIWPIRGKIISSFGQTFNNMLNKGIHIQPYKNLEVIASRSGKVVFYKDGFLNFGKTVIIEHSEGFSTVYAGIAEVFVKTGDFVQKGQVIAKLDESGTENNKYLHFELRKGVMAQNPNFYLPH